MLTENKNRVTQNLIRAIKWNFPEWIPCRIWMPPATWEKYGTDLQRLVDDHSRIVFEGSGLKRSDPIYRKGTFVDAWGCVWENIADGMAGLVAGHPLERWRCFKGFQPPDLLIVDRLGRPRNWKRIKESLEKDREEGRLATGNCHHGFMFQTLCDLRGFESLMIDIATDSTELRRLIATVLEQNQRLIDAWLEVGVEIMRFGDDLGSQRALPMSPYHWRKYLGPCYEQMYGACQQAGVAVYMHSDGRILEIIPDLIESGVTIINPQIRANGLEALGRICKGKICVDLDLDRQLFPFVTSQQIKDHVREAIDVLGSSQGGLMLIADCEPVVPFENIVALCEAFEEQCF